MPAAATSRPVTFVSFSGVDGAGKSTQILALRSHLEQKGSHVRVIAFWDHIARLTRLREGAGHRILKGDKGIGSPSAPINRRDKNVRSWPMSCARLFFYLIDAISTRAAVAGALRSGADFVIFDRYIYDELANLNLRNPLMRAYARLILKFVPRPHVSYLLDANPLEARARKPEYPVDFIHINRKAYFDLARLAGGITVIPPGPIEQVRTEVLRHALAALRRDLQSNAAGNGVSLQRAG